MSRAREGKQLKSYNGWWRAVTINEATETLMNIRKKTIERCFSMFCIAAVLKTINLYTLMYDSTISRTLYTLQAYYFLRIAINYYFYIFHIANIILMRPYFIISINLKMLWCYCVYNEAFGFLFDLLLAI